jgi:hypothetical protein
VIPGFNLDIRYKGKTFHIQTEDSGVANPVIMTHLFLFGTILGSRKFDYAHVAGQPNVADLVREHMRAELRAMHAALLAGEFDELARRPMSMKKKGPALPLASDAPEAASQRAAEVATPAVAEEEIDDFGSEDLEPVEDLGVVVELALLLPPPEHLADLRESGDVVERQDRKSTV